MPHWDLAWAADSKEGALSMARNKRQQLSLHAMRPKEPANGLQAAKAGVSSGHKDRHRRVAEVRLICGLSSLLGAGCKHRMGLYCYKQCWTMCPSTHSGAPDSKGLRVHNQAWALL